MEQSTWLQQSQRVREDNTYNTQQISPHECNGCYSKFYVKVLSDVWESSQHGRDSVNNIYNTFSLTYMYYNKWISSSVKQRLKQHALQVFKISLTIVTIHVWKHDGLLVGFWIKRKFQDTSLHHTSPTSHAKRWSHYLLLKEKITDSQGYVGGAELKIPLHVKMRGYL